MVGDDRRRGLLGLERVAAGERDPDLGEVEQAVDLDVLALVRAGRIAPRVAASLVEVDPEVATDLGVQPFGQALGGLYPEPVDEELLGELAVALELARSARSPPARP